MEVKGELAISFRSADKEIYILAYDKESKNVYPESMVEITEKALDVAAKYLSENGIKAKDTKYGTLMVMEQKVN